MKNYTVSSLIISFFFIVSACKKIDLYSTNTSNDRPEIIAFDSRSRIMLNQHSEIRINTYKDPMFLKGGAFVTIEGSELGGAPMLIVIDGVTLETTDIQMNIDAYDVHSGKGRLTIFKGMLKFKNSETDTILTSGNFWFGNHRLDSTTSWAPEAETQWLNKVYKFSSLKFYDLMYALHLFYRVDLDYSAVSSDRSAVFVDVNFEMTESLDSFVQRLQTKTRYKLRYTPEYSIITILKE